MAITYLANLLNLLRPMLYLAQESNSFMYIQGWEVTNRHAYSYGLLYCVALFGELHFFHLLGHLLLPKDIHRAESLACMCKAFDSILSFFFIFFWFYLFIVIEMRIINTEDLYILN